MYETNRERSATGLALRGALYSAALPLVFVAGGCVQVQPQPDFDRARQLVRETTGQQDVFAPSGPGVTREEIAQTLSDGLSLDEALRLSLLNSRELQADFQDIGVAYTDQVQAGLLSNPSLDILLRYPTGGGRSQVDGSLVADLLESWRIPLRKERAQHELDGTVLRVARRAGERLTEARNAYYEAVAAGEMHRVAEENLALVTRSFEAVAGLHENGAADALDEGLARGPVLAARRSLQSARLGAAEAKRELARRLSIDSSVESVRLTDSLPETLPIEGEAEDLVRLALSSRLDLQAMAKSVDAATVRVQVERRKAWGGLAGGVSSERPAESGSTIVGPVLSLTLPVFDQNQAQIAKAEFQCERLVKLYEAARIAVAQDVRSGIDRARTAATTLALYRDELLPQATRTLSLARVSYTEGRTRLATLIVVQRRLLDARQEYIEVRLERAVAAAELERVVGTGPLSHRPVPTE